MKAPLCTFLAEKTASFGLLSKSCSKKYSLYTVSICIFDAKNVFSRYDFLMIFCSILHQSTILHLFVRKNCFIWPFFKKLQQNVQSIHCLDLHFWCQNSFFRGTIFWYYFVRFFIRAPLCTLLAENSASFSLFSKSCSKKYSLYTVSICILMQKCFFRGTIFWWYFVRFFIRAPFCTFLSEKTASIGIFSKSCSKKYSLYTVSICIFDGKIIFFEERFFDDILFDSLSKHHGAPFWPKKLLNLASFQKVPANSTVYTLSRLAFLMPKKFFSR